VRAIDYLESVVVSEDELGGLGERAIQSTSAPICMRKRGRKGKIFNVEYRTAEPAVHTELVIFFQHVFFCVPKRN
jgi:hypothetical protein